MPRALVALVAALVVVAQPVLLASPAAAADESAPVITSPRDGSSTTDATPTVRGTAASAASQVFVEVDGAETTEPQAGGSSWSWTVPDALQPGKHSLQAWSRSKAQGSSPLSDAVTFVVAKEGPGTPTVDTPEDGATVAQQSTATGSVSGDGTTARVVVVLDGDDAGPASLGRAGWSFTLPTLDAGKHTLGARAVDADGVESAESDTHTFVVEPAAEEGEATPVVTSPRDGSTTADRTPVVRGTAAHADSQVFVELDGKEPDEPQASGTRWSWSVPDALEPGRHELRVRSTSDEHGKSDWSGTTAFEVAKEGPGTPGVKAPEDGAVVGQDAAAGGTVSDEGTRTTRVVVTVDDEDAGEAVLDGTTWSYALSGLDPGTHRLHVRAYDDQGVGSDDSDERTFEVTAVETTPTITAPRDGVTTADRAPTVRGTAAHGDSQVYVVLDGATTKRPQASGTSWSWTVPRELEPGEHTVQAFSVSRTAGRSEWSRETTFTVAEKGPGVPGVTVPDEGALLNRRVLLSGPLSDDGTPTSRVLVAIDGTDVGEAKTDGTSWYFPLRRITPGTHVLRVRAVDDASVESAESAPRSFVVDAGETVPVVTSPADGSVTVDRTPTILGTAAHADSQVLVEVDGTVPDEPQASGTRWSWTVPDELEPGHHELRVSSTSRSGRSAWSAAVGFDVAKEGPEAPVVLEPRAGAVVKSEPTAYGTAPDGGTRATSVRVLVDRQQVAEERVDGPDWKVRLPALADGEHTVAAVLVDDGGVTSAPSDEVPFTVDSGVRPPTITGPEDGSATVDRAPTVVGTAQHDDSVVSVELDGELHEQVAEGTSWAWTPDELKPGRHTLRAYSETETYGRTGWSATVTFEVREKGPGTPRVEVPEDGGTLTPGDQASGPLADDGTETVAVRVFVDGVDQGRAVVEDRRWSFVVGRLTPGRHTLAVQAVDADGTGSVVSAEVSFGLEGGAPPEITAPTDGTVTSAPPAVEGRADPGSTVYLVVDDEVRAKTPTDDDGRWSFAADEVGAGPGRHTLAAYQLGRDGRTSDRSAVVTYVDDETPPGPPTLETPVDGDVLDGSTFEASGTGEPGATVQVLLDDEQVATAPVDAGSGRWATTLATPGRGRHTVTVRQTDPAGNASEPTDPVTVEAAGPPPAPVVTDLPGGSPTRDPDVVVVGTAEAGAKVVLSADDTQVGAVEADGDGSWKLTVRLADGAHAVTARAFDRFGGSEASAPRTVVVDTTAPAAPVVGEPSGSAPVDDRPDVRGTGEPGAQVVLTLDGAEVTTTEPIEVDRDGGWAYAWAGDPLSAGTHTLTAVLRDAAGNESAAAERTFRVGGTGLAVLRVTSPEDGDTVTTAEVAVTGVAAPDVEVLVRVSGDLVGSADADGDGGFALTTKALPDGPQVLSVVQRGADQVESDPVEVRITVATGAPDTQAPEPPTIAGPTAGDRVGAQPTLTGSGEPGAVLRVYRGADLAELVGSTIVEEEGSWTVRTNALPDGPVVLAATQTDDAGNTSGPTTVDLTVDATGPDAPTIASPADRSVLGDGHAVEVRGSAEPGSTVTVLDGDVVVGQARTGKTGGWTLTTDLAAGLHLLTARATDAYDNPSPTSAAVQVVVAGRPVVTAPADGSATSTERPTFRGTGTPGTLVTVVVHGFRDVSPRLALGPQAGDALASTTVLDDGTWSAVADTDLVHGLWTVVAEQGLVLPPPPDQLARAVAAPTSDEVTFAVATGPRITSPTDFEEVGRTWTACGVGEPGYAIRVLDDDDSLVTDAGETTVGADGTWCVQVDDDPGEHVRVPEQHLGDRYDLQGPAVVVDVVAPGSGGSDGSGSSSGSGSSGGSGSGSGSGSALAATGGPAPYAALAGLLLVAAGGVLLTTVRRRRRA